eukprot:6495831-Pyramimonas_sp.AAC.1
MVGRGYPAKGGRPGVLAHDGVPRLRVEEPRLRGVVVRVNRPGAVVQHSVHVHRRRVVWLLVLKLPVTKSGATE